MDCRLLVVHNFFLLHIFFFFLCRFVFVAKQFRLAELFMCVMWVPWPGDSDVDSKFEIVADCTLNDSEIAVIWICVRLC